MFHWKKLGRIFDPQCMASPDWMHEFAQSPATIINPHTVRVFFCTRPAPSADGKYQSHIAYLDLDRKNLLNVIKISAIPVLELGKVGTFDEHGTYPVSVISYQNEIRAYYAGISRCESVPFNATIGLAVSQDGGESFHRLGEGPVLPYTSDEPFLLGSPRIRRFEKQWQLWYVAGKEWRITEKNKKEPIYKIRMATSTDGIQWNKLGRDLIPNKLGEHECQACPDVIYRDGKYHMFFSYRDIYNYTSREGGYRIGYASSPDMTTWTRNDDLIDIQLSKEGWDSEMINYPHVFELDGSIYMLYQGNGMGRSGFGLAVLDKQSIWS